MHQSSALPLTSESKLESFKIVFFYSDQGPGEAEGRLGRDVVAIRDLASA